MKGYVAIGKQSIEGEATTVARFWRVVGMSQEVCEVCDEIGERDGMVFVGSDDYGQALYTHPEHPVP